MSSNENVILNPEAVGDPNRAPVVRLSTGMATMLERTRCPECRLVNRFHEATCSRRGDDR